jgi:PhoPQ-activated pathogenicity-related protein
VTQAIRYVCIILVASFAAFVAPFTQAAEPIDGALARYVAKEDASYGWVIKQRGELEKTSYVEMILTSQTWRDIVWKHQLFVIRPSTATDDTTHALLFITGGNWKDELETDQERRMPRDAALFAAIAEQIQTPIAVLLQVPRQPIFDGKVEDQIIAMTFDEYLKSGDTEWPLLLPMVKSAVRAMDAVQEASEKEWGLKLKTFTVTGASKRGWTTWLTGAVDRRSTAICPMVIDVLNMGPQMKHQQEAFGDYSHKIDDYTTLGIQDRMDTEAGAQLRRLVDPFTYRDRLTQPKLIMLGTNDEYWPLDALNLYWSELKGPKYVLYIPNNGHGLKDYGRIVGSLCALHRQACGELVLPKLDWKFENDGDKLTLRVTSDVRPTQVDAWFAASDSRDFRKSQWSSRPATADGDAYLCELEIPASGYAALYGEVVFADGTLPYFLSTNVEIVQGGGK